MAAPIKPVKDAPKEGAGELKERHPGLKIDTYSTVQTLRNGNSLRRTEPPSLSNFSRDPTAEAAKVTKTSSSFFDPAKAKL